MGFRIVAPNDFKWIVRPHDEGEPARHVAELSDAAGFAHTRANVWRYEPGAKGRRHRHRHQEETFLVLAGTLTMYLGEPPERVEAPPGGLIHVDAGTPLQTVNHGTEDLVVYVHGYPPEDEHAEILESVADEKAVEVLLISGSTRAGSSNTAVLRTAASLAPAGIRTAMLAGAGALPLYNPDDDAEGTTVHPAVAAMRAAVARADAILICTPEYAGALPAAMKNLLEWTIGDAGTYGKPVAWINASGAAAPTGGADAHESLAKVLRYSGADVVQDACARIPISRDLVDDRGLIRDERTRAQILSALRRLAVSARPPRAPA